MPSEFDPELDPAFEVLEPRVQSLPIVLDSPHSGCVYPRRFLSMSRLDAMALRRSEDAFVDELVLGAVERGAPLLRAHFPRAYLDLNREPYELDQRMFEDRLPLFANTRSPRVAGGLGTIARVVSEAQEIYARRLPVAEALGRIERFYQPYHGLLRRLVARTRQGFGHAILLDCHSMPSTGAARDDRMRSDIVLGDRFGASAAPAITAAIELFLRARGYAVVRNRPYAGGYITEHYGAPGSGVHAVQIEINRALYMDETRMERLPRFGMIARDLADLVSAIGDSTGRLVATPRCAAE